MSENAPPSILECSGVTPQDLPWVGGKAVNLARLRHHGQNVPPWYALSTQAFRQALRESGLDSIRVSLNSCRPLYYENYYKPKGYGLETVRTSIRVMKSLGGFVSLNYFVLPGLTDERDELEALSDLITDTGIDFIQMRNLNIDPEWYLERIGFKPRGETIGIHRFLQIFEDRFPDLRFGYFNPCLDPGA